MIKRFLACVVTLSAVATGCGGVVEADPEPSATHHEEALPTCASVDGHGCSPFNNPEKFCVYSDGVMGECWCQEPINKWGCARVTE